MVNRFRLAVLGILWAITAAAQRPAGPVTASVVTGDFNADGKADAAVTNRATESVAIYLGDGAGNFRAGARLALTGEPVGIVTGDFDGDKAADLAVALSDGTVAVYQGDGAGGFAAFRTKPYNYLIGTGAGNGSIAAGDFNHDGKLDIALASQALDRVTILLGDGEGGFRMDTSVLVLTGSGPVALTAADLDRDGNLDLVAANSTSGSLTFLQGNGQGGFTRFGPDIVLPAGAKPVSIAVGDFDSDRKLDIVVLDEALSKGYVLRGDGAGGFLPFASEPLSVPGSTTVASADLNGDSYADLIFFQAGAAGIRVFVGKGDGTFHGPGESMFSTQKDNVSAGGFTLADLNGDRLPDLVFAVQDGILSTLNRLQTLPHSVQNTPISKALLNVVIPSGTLLPSGNPFAVGTNPQAIVAADFDHDGIPDIAVVDSSGSNVTVGLARQGLGFVHASGGVIAIGSRPAAIVSEDFNNDGKADLAVLGASALIILLGDGAGGFTQVGSGTSVTDAVSLAAADINGDGKVDLVTSLDIDFWLLLGKGDGTFEAPKSLGPRPPGSYGPVATTDLNGDGKPDIALVSPRAVSVYLNAGASTLSGSPVVTAISALSATAVVAADLNRDNKMDLVILDPSSGALILLGDGAGGFSTQGSLSVANPLSVAVADFDGDGIPDLSIATSTSLQVYLGDGAGSFQLGFTGPGTPVPVSAAVGDFNDDRRQDVAVLVSTELDLFVGGPASTNLALTTTANSSVNAGSSIPLTAQVTSAGFRKPAGLVAFKNGNTVLQIGSAVGGQALYTATLTTAGVNSLSAGFSGDSRVDSASVSSPLTITVNAGPASNLAFSALPATATALANATFSVSIQDVFGNQTIGSGVPITLSVSGPGTVNGVTTVSSIAGSASFLLRFSIPGSYTITAAAFRLTSASASISVAASVSYAVTNFNDDGPGSLRAAVTSANSAGGGQVAYTAGSPGTVTLTSGVIAISSWTTISGGGLTISGANNSQIFLISDQVTLQNLTLISGKAAGDGGAISVSPSGSLTVQRCTFQGNVAGNGGAIASAGALTVTNSTLTGNSAAGAGGGIYSSGTGNLLIIVNSTVTANVAAHDGGIGVLTGTTTSLQSTIVAGNANLLNVSDDCSACVSLPGTNFVGGDPKLLSLTNNGGLTPTMLPSPSSPVRNVGNGTLGGALDQRGLPRPSGNFDLGAVQTNYTLAFLQQPVNTPAPSSISPPVTVRTLESGSLFTQASVLISLSSRPPNAGPGDPELLSGGAPQSTVSGIATFAGLSIDIPGTRTLFAASAAFSAVASNSFNIVPGPPFSIQAVSGSPQTYYISFAFPASLVVIVRDAVGNPTPGIPVTFTAPGAGPSLTVAASQVNTDSSGRASIQATANGFGGSFPVSAAFANASTPARFDLTSQTANPNVSPASLAFTYSPGVAPAAQVLSLTANGPATSFSVSIPTADAGWLKASAMSGTLPQTVSVSVSAASLLPDIHSSSIIFQTLTGSVTVPVNLLVLTPLTLGPAAQTLSYVVGDPPPVLTAIRLTASSPVPFTASVLPAVNSSTPVSWLTYRPPVESGTTPADLTPTLNLSGITPGIYSALVSTESVDGSNNPQTAAVTLSVKAKLSMPSASAQFVYSLGSPTPASQIVVTSTAPVRSAQALSDAKWLLINGANVVNFSIGASLSANLTLSIDPQQIKAGTYSATIQFSSDEAVPSSLPKPLTLAVSLTASVPLSVSCQGLAGCAGLNFSSFLGGASPPDQTIQLKAGSGLALFNVTSSGGSWLKATPSGSVTPASIVVSVNPATLKTGNYSGQIVISALNTVPSSISIPVNLAVTAGGEIDPASVPSSIQLGASTSGSQTVSRTLALASKAPSVPAPFQISIGPTSATPIQPSGALPAPTAGTFLTVTPTSGITPALITLTANPGNLAPGYIYTAAVSFASQSKTPLISTVTFTVAAAPPVLSISPTALSITVQKGSRATGTAQVSLKGGSGALNYSVSSSAQWLALQQTAGTLLLLPGSVAPVSFSVDPTNLAPGFTQGTVTATLNSSPQQKVQLSVNVQVQAPGPTLDLPASGTTIVRVTESGSASSQDIPVINKGGQTLAWRAAFTAPTPYFSLANSSGNSLPQSAGFFTIQVNTDFAKTARPGTYSAQVQVSALGLPSKFFTATLLVYDPAHSAVPFPEPTGLVFTAAQGGDDPGAQTFEVFTNSNNAQAFLAGAQTFSGATSWLSATPVTNQVSTAQSATVNVSVHINGLDPGIYTGGVTVSIGSEYRVVSVSLVVTAPKKSSQVTSSARAGSRPALTLANDETDSCTASELQPTVRDGLAGNFSTAFANPVVVVVQIVDSCGNFVPGNVQGAKSAFVTIDFDQGPTTHIELDLSRADLGIYTGSWTPGLPAGPVNATITAVLDDLSGNSTSTVITQSRKVAVTTVPTGSALLQGQVTGSSAPALFGNGITNLFDPQSAPRFAPGSLVTLSGANLDGARVQVDGITAPVITPGSAQLTVQIPVEARTQLQAPLQVIVNGVYAAASYIDIIPASPALEVSANGFAAAQHTDSRPVTGNDPAMPGEQITIFLSGMGATSPPVATGKAGISPLDPALNPKVLLDGVAVNMISFAGLTSNSPGLYQVVFTVPLDTSKATPTLVVSEGAGTIVLSNSGLLPVGVRPRLIRQVPQNKLP